MPLPDLSARLAFDGSAFTAGVNKAKQETGSLATSMAGQMSNVFSGNFFTGLFANSLGAVGLGAVAALGERMASALQEKFKSIQIGSALTGLSPETFQKVSNVAEATGASVENVAVSMQHIAIAQEKVKNGDEGSDKLLESFHALGISLTDLEDASYQQIFFKIAEGMKSAQMSGEKLAAVHEVLGRGAIQLLPAFQKGFDSKAANRGILDEGQLEELKQVRDMSAESAGLWKDMGNAAGIWAAKALAGIKGVALLPGMLSDMHDRFKNGPNTEASEEVKFYTKNATRLEQMAERTAEKDRKRAQEQAASKAADIAGKEDQKKIAQDISHLEEERDRKTEKNQTDGMTKAQKLAFFKAQAAKEEALANEYQARFDANNIPADRREALGHRNLALDARHEFAQLSERIRPRDMDLGSNARIGGFTQNAGNAERTWQQEMLLTNKTIAKNTDPASE